MRLPILAVSLLFVSACGGNERQSVDADEPAPSKFEATRVRDGFETGDIVWLNPNNIAEVEQLAYDGLPPSGGVPFSGYHTALSVVCELRDSFSRSLFFECETDFGGPYWSVILTRLILERAGPNRYRVLFLDMEGAKRPSKYRLRDLDRDGVPEVLIELYGYCDSRLVIVRLNDGNPVALLETQLSKYPGSPCACIGYETEYDFLPRSGGTASVRLKISPAFTDELPAGRCAVALEVAEGEDRGEAFDQYIEDILSRAPRVNIYDFDGERYTLRRGQRSVADWYEEDGY